MVMTPPRGRRASCEIRRTPVTCITCVSWWRGRRAEGGDGWADDLGLPVALDTDTDENVAFYERRGYEVIARKRLADTDQDLVAMRRRGAGRRTGGKSPPPG